MPISPPFKSRVAKPKLYSVIAAEGPGSTPPRRIRRPSGNVTSSVPRRNFEPNRIASCAARGKSGNCVSTFSGVTRITSGMGRPIIDGGPASQWRLIVNADYSHRPVGPLHCPPMAWIGVAPRHYGNTISRAFSDRQAGFCSSGAAFCRLAVLNLGEPRPCLPAGAAFHR